MSHVHVYVSLLENVSYLRETHFGFSDLKNVRDVSKFLIIDISRDCYISDEKKLDLGGGFKYFLFSPLQLGKMNPF